MEAVDGPLCQQFDVVLFDLDGVVYIGEDPVAHAADSIEAARARGARTAFITNNASRPPEAVARRIAKAGVAVEPEEIVTSAQAAAHLLLDRFGDRAPVAVLGGEGLRTALEAVGLRPTGVEDDAAVAVVSGYGPEVLWREVMRAAVRIRDGLPWVASNTDTTIPTAYGIAPGHGVQVGLLRSFSGVDPVVAGKPERPLFTETLERTGAERPLMVGDRLDTDIEGAKRAGIASLLVMTGVTHLADLVAAEPHLRPTYLAADLRGLVESHPAPEGEGGTWRCGGWTARTEDGALHLDGEGGPADWWRTVAAAAWAHLDAAGRPVGVEGLTPPG